MQLLDRLARHAADRPTAVAYHDAATGAVLTWGELRQRVADLAPALGKQAWVRIELANTLDFPVAFLAALSNGNAAFLVSPAEPPAALAAVDVNCARVADHTGIRPCPCGPPPFEPASDLLLLSSGSTAAPKVVRRTAAAVDAVCQQMVAAIGFTAADHVLATVPLCHSYGVEHGLLAPVWAGATVSLCRGLDLSAVRRALPLVTVLPGVPATFEALVRLGEQPPALRAAYSAGGPLPSAVAAACHDALGFTVGQVYGATEIGSVTYTADADGTVGRAMPTVAVRADVDGQVMVAGPSLFDGYVGEVNPTTPDGFYLTGDLGHVDDAGRLRLTGRARLLIDVGGRKVNPIEVEAVLMDHPRVGGCVVVAVHQTATVARLKAVVEPRRPGPPPDPEELRAFARARLAAHKVPRSFEVRAALPRSPAGKVLRMAVTA